MKKTLLSIIAGLTLTAQATVTLPSYFSDNMVVQQQSALIVKGKASRPGTVTVSASWDKKTFTCTTDAAGTFSISVPTPAASTRSHTITVSDGDATVLSNVAVGEVWLCSGQSNMEMPVNGWGKVKDYEQELKDANYAHIRLLQAKRVVSVVPTDDLQLNNGAWNVCSTASVDNFSACAYFFARRLWNVLKVPIGVIDSSWGGTPAEAWTSATTLTTVTGLEQHAANMLAAKGNMGTLEALYQREMGEWNAFIASCDAGMDGNKPRWTEKEASGDGWMKMNLPIQWEQAGLPNFDGIVWFQKVVEIPENWAGKPITLKFKADDIDETYFNGAKVGETDGYNIERNYTIPASLVKAGRNIVTIRCKDTGGEGGIWGEKEQLCMQQGDATIALAGEWNARVGVALSEMSSMARPEPPTSQNYCSNLYNSMIYPLRDFAIQGAIWYQGESNADRWQQYTPLFQAMIHDWRALWHKEIPFYFVQIANWQARHAVQPQSHWAHLREAQTNALALSNTGMAVTIDIGEAWDIHPKNKQEVGLRLANAALAQTYHRGTYTLPLYDNKMIIMGNRAILTFNQPLIASSGAVEGFIIAGPDMKFHTAQATISGNTITVWSSEVTMPVAVRYAWGDNPACNVRGASNDLPLTPFRTDRHQ